ncbi:formamidopyrimidine-DNA glycosylase [Xylaria nigripes]|nr:formamidopyrimidine-DNA glycosylase [Xylaria nigripes]
MPEIAEVARVTHFLRQNLVGKTIRKVVAQDDNSIFGKVGASASAFEAALTGKRVVRAGNKGKYFWLELDKPPHPVMHFGMTGWIHIRGEQTLYNRYAEKLGAVETWPPKYWKFYLETNSQPVVGVSFTDARRFGRIRLVDCPGPEITSHSPLVENGPDPVVDRKVFTEEYLKQKMQSRHVPVKVLLLDQATISGIGNWVGDEIMYQAGLHPEQYCDDFSDAEIARLYKAICYICDVAVEKLGDSEQFPEDWLFHHRWNKGKKGAEKTLPNGEQFVFVTVGGRTSCVVPSRQKMTGRVAADTKEEGPKRSTKKEKSSRFFDDDNKDGDGDQEAETKTRTAKKPRTKTTRKTKEESPSADEIDSKPKKGVRKTKKSVAPSPENTGRRRSTRLRKTKS